MSADLRHYLAACETFRREIVPPSPDWATICRWDLDTKSLAPTLRLGHLRQRLADSLPALPPPYRAAYGERFLEHLDHWAALISAQLCQDIADGIDRATALWNARLRAETFVEAVTNWSDPAHKPALRRFALVVAEIYTASLLEPPTPEDRLPPLVCFASPPDAGAATLNQEVVRQHCRATIGLVSLPVHFGNAVLLWPALAHEVGGHDVLHTIPGLLDELVSCLDQQVDAGGWNPLWRAWMEETAADVLGLLNIGPAAAVSLAAYLAASRSYDLVPPGPLGALGSTIVSRLGQPLDSHPPDILRICVARGVLKGLDPQLGRIWAPLLDEIIRLGAAAAPLIIPDPPHAPPRPNPRDISLVSNGIASLPGLPFVEAARTAMSIGTLIATSPLRALNGQSLQDRVCWDMDDEAIAAEICARALAGENLDGLGDSGHLLAGATMALLQGGRPNQIAAALAAALDAACTPAPT